MSDLQKLNLFIDGEFIPSQSGKYTDAYNPSTGEVIALVPCCTKEEVHQAVAAAKKAYAGWSKTPILKRVQVLYKMRDLINSIWMSSPIWWPWKMEKPGKKPRGMC